jgi:hypothetical protein
MLATQVPPGRYGSHARHTGCRCRLVKRRGFKLRWLTCQAVSARPYKQVGPWASNQTAADNEVPAVLPTEKK